jgi:HlyD family secretion protein
MTRHRQSVLRAAAGAALVLGLLFGASCRESGKKVRARKVERGALVATVSCNGRIEAHRKVDLSANVPGQIVNISVREGDLVKKGDLLLQIDRTNLQAQSDSSRAALEALLSDRDAARASVEQARLDLERARVSFDSGLVSRSDLDRAKTGQEQAQATLAASENRIDQARATHTGARDTLGKTTITAPISGQVTRLAVEEGEVAVIGTMNNPGTVLLTISDLSEIEATMEVDETDVPTIRLGQRATVTLDAYPNQEFAGEVSEVGSSPIQSAADLAGGSESIDFEVRVRLLSPPEGLKPGLSASAAITTGEKEGILAVPIQALVLREQERDPSKLGAKLRDEEGVFSIEGGKVRFLPIETGMSGELDVEVVSGLQGGEEIVIGPYRLLRELEEGDPVVIDDSLPGKAAQESP